MWHVIFVQKFFCLCLVFTQRRLQLILINSHLRAASFALTHCYSATPMSIFDSIWLRWFVCGVCMSAECAGNQLNQYKNAENGVDTRVLAPQKGSNAAAIFTLYNLNKIITVKLRILLIF